MNVVFSRERIKKEKMNINEIRACPNWRTVKKKWRGTNWKKNYDDDDDRQIIYFDDIAKKKSSSVPNQKISGFHLRAEIKIRSRSRSSLEINFLNQLDLFKISCHERIY